MKKQQMFSNLLNNVESYEPSKTLHRLQKNTQKIIESCDKHFPSNKKLLEEVFQQNPYIKSDNFLQERVINFKNEIGKENQLLLSGEVAAIDGTTKFSIDNFVFHHYFSIVTGYISYKKNDFRANAEHWDTALSFDDINTKYYDDIDRIEAMLTMTENHNAPKNDIMLYKERELALRLKHKYIFLDGPIFFDSLLGYEEAFKLYEHLIDSDKKLIGIIKDITKNKELIFAAESLNSGEARIVGDSSYKSKEIKELENYYMGVFKIRNKAYGFEVHKDILMEMLALVFNDCKDYSSYEIPWLLSAIDKGIKLYNESNGTEEFISSRIQMNHPDFFSLITSERTLR